MSISTIPWWIQSIIGEPSGFMRETCGPLEVHSDTVPVPNNRWDKETLSTTELEGIRPFLKQIRAMKDQGLSGVGVVASFIRCRLQPLQERIHYGFKYTSLEDLAHVPTDELMEGEVLERI